MQVGAKGRGPGAPAGPAPRLRGWGPGSRRRGPFARQVAGGSAAAPLQLPREGFHSGTWVARLRKACMGFSKGRAAQKGAVLRGAGGRAPATPGRGRLRGTSGPIRAPVRTRGRRARPSTVAKHNHAPGLRTRGGARTRRSSGFQGLGAPRGAHGARRLVGAGACHVVVLGVWGFSAQDAAKGPSCPRPVAPARLSSGVALPSPFSHREAPAAGESRAGSLTPHAPRLSSARASNLGGVARGTRCGALAGRTDSESCMRCRRCPKYHQGRNGGAIWYEF